MIAVIENISIEYHVSVITRTNKDKDQEMRYTKAIKVANNCLDIQIDLTLMRKDTLYSSILRGFLTF